MGMPTESELGIALAEAGRMREHGSDPKYLAKCLLNLNYRVQQLEKVLKAAELLFHSGMAVQEQTRLRKAIEEAKGVISRTGGDVRPDWTLS
jgi:hypothetical protein